MHESFVYFIQLDYQIMFVSKRKINWTTKSWYLQRLHGDKHKRITELAVMHLH